MQDPSSQRLHWISSPNNILIIRKPGPSTLPEFRMIIGKLLKVRFLSTVNLCENLRINYLFQRRLRVYVEPPERLQLSLDTNPDLKEHSTRCIAFDHGMIRCRFLLI